MTDIVERLRKEGENDRMILIWPQNCFLMIEAADELSDVRAERDALQSRIDEVREIYAGMEGFIPETAPEGYLQRIIKQMYDAAVRGEKKNG